MLTTWYQIEEYIPAEKAIGGTAYWTAMVDDCAVWRSYHWAKALATFQRLKDQGREVRLVRLTSEVVTP